MALDAADIQALAGAIGQAIEETAPIKQIHISRYKAQTPFNPTGNKQRPKLNGKYWQNGYPLRPQHMTDEEITLANQIRPGRYFDRIVEVVERHENGEREVEIRYSNATVEQKMNNKNQFRNFKELCEGILTESKPKGRVVAATA